MRNLTKLTVLTASLTLSSLCFAANNINDGAAIANTYNQQIAQAQADKAKAYASQFSDPNNAQSKTATQSSVTTMPSNTPQLTTPASTTSDSNNSTTTDFGIKY